MEVIVLAVTRAFGRYCVAGKTFDGRRVRPIPPQQLVNRDEDRFWFENQIRFDERLLQIGDIIDIEGYLPREFRYANHTEDFITTRLEKIGRLSIQELIDFLDDHVEDYQAFSGTVTGNNGRSLCIIEVEEFFHYARRYEGDLRITMSFTHPEFDVDNPLTTNGDYKVKDCRWEELIATNNVPQIRYNRLFFCVGLATPYRGVEYPMAIGVIPDYEIPVIVNR